MHEGVVADAVRYPKKPDAGDAHGNSPSDVATSTMNAIRLLSMTAHSASARLHRAR
jgi:hypothetical protein